MRALVIWILSFMLLMLSVAAPPALASPCKSRCRDQARACKYSCKANHPPYGPRRRQCADACKAREYNCKSRCQW